MFRIAAAFYLLLFLGFLNDGMLTSAKEDLKRQKRVIPFIYPGGSVIQFALGMALPANVKGKNVATNSGILINIDLPTNLSQLRPPERSIRSTGEHSWVSSQITSLLGISEGEFGSCFVELDCYRQQIARRDTFTAEILHAILLSMLMYVRLCGFPITWLKFSLIRNVFYTLYDITVFLFCIYIIVCALFTLKADTSFEDLCCIGIVVSQMTNGVLITFYYIFFKNYMTEAMLKIDSISKRILASPLGSHDFFINLYYKDRNLIALFTKASIAMNFAASWLYCLPTPMIDLYNGVYRRKLPIPVEHIGFSDFHKAYIFEFIIIQQVLILVYSSIKKVGNDCIFLSFFKMQASYLKYLSVVMRSIGGEIVENGGTDNDGKLSHWIHLHQDILSTTRELVSLYAPIIVLYYTNMICILAFGLFLQLRGDQVDTLQSVAITLWIGTIIFVLFLQSAVADELKAESENVAVEAYFIPWYYMQKDVQKKLPLIIMLANHPIHLTAYRAVSFILNKETFLAFIMSVITAYMGFSKIGENVDTDE